jgi:hypothetical protein
MLVETLYRPAVSKVGPRGRMDIIPCALHFTCNIHVAFKLCRSQDDGDFESAYAISRTSRLRARRISCIMISSRDDQEQGKRKSKSDFRPNLARHVFVEAKIGAIFSPCASVTR